MKPIYSLGLLCLISCATEPKLVWRQNNKTEQDFLKDKTDCRAKAGQAMTRVRNLDLDRETTTFIQECLKGQGWVQMQEITTDQALTEK